MVVRGVVLVVGFAVVVVVVAGSSPVVAIVVVLVAVVIGSPFKGWGWFSRFHGTYCNIGL